MPLPRVYIETTIPSFYHEDRPDPELQAWRVETRRWWDDRRHQYELFTSLVTTSELAATPEPKASACLELLRDVPVLAMPDGLDQLMDFYVEQRLMPRGADAAHVAIASLHGIDFVLTWNCRHIANANKFKHLAVLNGRLGLPCPILTTPLSLNPEDRP